VLWSSIPVAYARPSSVSSDVHAVRALSRQTGCFRQARPAPDLIQCQQTWLGSHSAWVCHGPCIKSQESERALITALQVGEGQ
jgi:hypothetical protein